MSTNPPEEKNSSGSAAKSLGLWVGLVSTVASTAVAILAGFNGSPIVAVVACGGVGIGILLLSVLHRAVKDSQTSDAKFWIVVVRGLTLFILIYFLSIAVAVWSTVREGIQEYLNKSKNVPISKTDGNNAPTQSNKAGLTVGNNEPSGGNNAPGVGKPIDGKKPSEANNAVQENPGPGTHNDKPKPEPPKKPNEGNVTVPKPPKIVSPEDRANDLNRKGIQTKDYRKAIELYSKAIEIYPAVLHAHFNRGCSYYWLHEYEKAIPDLEESIKRDPKKEAVNYGFLGQCKFELKDYKGAIEVYNEGLREHPNDTGLAKDLATTKTWLPPTDEGGG